MFTVGEIAVIVMAVGATELLTINVELQVEIGTMVLIAIDHNCVVVKVPETAFTV
jgi:hypothetical protein